MTGPHNIGHTLCTYGADFVSWDNQPNVDGYAIRCWLDRVKADMASWGMDCFAYHTPLPMDLLQGLKRVVRIRTAALEPYGRCRLLPDVFENGWIRQAREIIAHTCATHAGDPLVLGYAYTDLPPLMIEGQPGDLPTNPWVDALRVLPPAAPGKRAWLDVLRRRHGDASQVAAVYGIPDSWQAISRTTDWSSPRDPKQALCDTEDMLGEIAQQWYAIHYGAVRSSDPHHLILRDKLHHVDSIPDVVWDAIAAHTDLLNIQWYATAETQMTVLEQLHARTGKPILMGDSSFSVVSPHQDRAKGVHCESLAEVGRAYFQYLKAMMGLPFVVGWHYCGYIEGHRDLATPDRWADAQSGFLDPWENPYDVVLAWVVKANQQACAWHQAAPSTD